MKKMPLPSPRSPQKLDRTIIQHAQQNVPVKKRAFAKPIWISGLATASVLGIAVLISQPKFAGITEQAETAAFSTGIQKVAPDKVAPAPSTSSASVSGTLMLKRAPVKKKQFHKLEAISASPLAATQLSDEEISYTRSRAEFDIDSLRAQLQTLSAQLDSGEASQAEAAYDALKRECSNCKLPDTLADAIEKHLGITAPPAP